jgi:hypothetical protein
LRHCALACGLLQLSDQLPSLSDIPLAYKPSWVTAEVFGLLLLAMYQSLVDLPSVVGIVEWGVFGIYEETEHSPLAVSRTRMFLQKRFHELPNLFRGY